MMFLQESGFDAKYILDIGVATGTPWISDIFPSATHILIEPDLKYNETIQRNYENLNYELINIALGAASSETADIKIVKSEIAASGEYLNGRTEYIFASVVALDDLKLTPSGHSIIKIDVDGYDIDVLHGGKNTIPKFDVLIIESKLKDIHKTISTVPDCFELWDIVNLSYGYGHLGEVDLVFKHNQLELEQPQGFIKNQPFRQGAEIL